MENECKEKNWRECCKYNFFDYCDRKESSEQRIATNGTKNFKQFFDKFKMNLPNESTINNEFKIKEN